MLLLWAVPSVFLSQNRTWSGMNITSQEGSLGFLFPQKGFLSLSFQFPKKFFLVTRVSVEFWLRYSIGHLNALHLLCSSSYGPVRAGGGSSCAPAEKQELWQEEVFYHLVCELTRAGLRNSHEPAGELQRQNLFSFLCSLRDSQGRTQPGGKAGPTQQVLAAGSPNLLLSPVSQGHTQV